MKWFRMNTWGCSDYGSQGVRVVRTLPGRRNIVISRRPKPDVNVEWYNHLAVAMQHVNTLILSAAGAVHHFAQMRGRDDCSACSRRWRGRVFEVPRGKLAWSSQQDGFRFELLKYVR